MSKFKRTRDPYDRFPPALHKQKAKKYCRHEWVRLTTYGGILERGETCIKCWKAKS